MWLKRRAKCDKIHLVPVPEFHKVHIWFLVESWIYNTIECLFFISGVEGGGPAFLVLDL